ncbi:hypothetical protein BD289DRAFT_482132 [Coniella lustricola]|uniref:Uncharacterized protein n=1 Tax=Coniella lustricola TaxID=2025994 RepID=A0A2T3A9T2_9PEZI|nr:hypothetical protein BD289DRAFT_482132 [Coniella lustricola]
MVVEDSTILGQELCSATEKCLFLIRQHEDFYQHGDAHQYEDCGQYDDLNTIIRQDLTTSSRNLASLSPISHSVHSLSARPVPCTITLHPRWRSRFGIGPSIAAKVWLARTGVGSATPVYFAAEKQETSVTSAPDTARNSTNSTYRTEEDLYLALHPDRERWERHFRSILSDKANTSIASFEAEAWTGSVCSSYCAPASRVKNQAEFAPVSSSPPKQFPMDTGANLPIAESNIRLKERSMQPSRFWPRDGRPALPLALSKHIFRTGKPLEAVESQPGDTLLEDVEQNAQTSTAQSQIDSSPPTSSSKNWLESKHVDADLDTQQRIFIEEALARRPPSRFWRNPGHVEPSPESYRARQVIPSPQ